MFRIGLVLFVVFGSPVSASQVTFSKDVAPVIYRNCAPCHHTGGIGPFPLISYQEVAKHAAQIVAVTGRRYMPPWPPEKGYGEFQGERRLNDADIRLLADWLKENRPEGDLRDLPAAPQFTSEWQMGKPDLILRMDRPFEMAAGGNDVFRNFVIKTDLKQARFIRGMELRLDNMRVVHHANVVLDRAESLRRRDGQDGRPGFPGMDVTTEAAANDFDPDSHFLFWKPGSVLKPEPDDMSWRLDPETDLILNLHLQATGKPESVRAEVGLYFAAQPPSRFPMLVQLEHDGAIDIPAGDRTFSIADHLVLPTDVDVLAIYPHAHYLGKLVEAWATLPDGTRRWLIRIPDWDINWQAVYDYRQPIALPKGTEIAMRITYDNSAANPRNSNNPPKRVLTGNRSEDEMGHVWLQLLPRHSYGGQDPRLVLQEAVMLRRLEKYPGDFLANYNLGALEQGRGEMDQAISSYRGALKAEPENATARNSLGAALLVENRVPEAVQEFQEALRVDSTYANARFNLAHALATQGELSAAAGEYQTFLKQKPEDAGAQADLGAIFFKQHEYREAVAHLREATRLDGKNADLEANLGVALAMTGDLPEAIQAFEAALRIDPAHQAARANLTRAQAQLASKR